MRLAGGKVGAAESARATTSGSAPSVVGFLRPNCKHTMHVATCLYLERSLKMNNRVISMLAEPFRTWHGLRCKADRDPSSCRRFCMDQASAELLSSWSEMLRLLHDLDILDLLGLSVLMGSWTVGLDLASPERISSSSAPRRSASWRLGRWASGRPDQWRMSSRKDGWTSCSVSPASRCPQCVGPCQRYALRCWMRPTTSGPLSSGT